MAVRYQIKGQVMHIKFRNVNEAFRELVKAFADPEWGEAVRSTSRNGDVLYIQEPVIITYTHPRERVLFNQARDCNPFFHLFESLWMLAGRNDVAPLAYYNSNIANYSDDGQTFNGAYGYRWSHARAARRGGLEQTRYETSEDQLRILIDHLRAVPDSRRAVLQMWNVEDDLLKVGPQNQSKDVCCNTHVYFAIRQEGHDANQPIGALVPRYVLDTTVCNRSNDLIWGLLGANVVHFSMLQEYMAACIGVEVGVYNQITNNCHVYLNDKWQPEKWLAEQPCPIQYPTLDITLVKDPAAFDEEVADFVERHGRDGMARFYREPFLRYVAQNMCLAFHFYKHRDYDTAMEFVSRVKADDWRIAGTNWLLKRKERYESNYPKS